MKTFKTTLCAFAILLSGYSAMGQDYKAFLQQGQKLYNERQYDAALKVLNAGLADCNEEGALELNSWIKKCNDAKSSLAAKAKADRERFILSTTDISFFSEGGQYEVTVDAAGDWEVISSPDWCSTDINDNSLVITCSKNAAVVMRTGEISLQMAYLDGKVQKFKTENISVSQDAREVESRRVRFVTNPGNAEVRFSDEKLIGMSNDVFTLQEGQHIATISKPMFKPEEVIVTITPDDVPGIISKHIELEPLFSKLKLSIESEDGSMISEEDMPSLRIDQQYIDLAPYFTGRGSFSFDSQEDISYYKLYEGNEIPVEPGSHIVTVRAENFYQYEDSLFIGREDEKLVEIILKPHKGTLHIYNAGGADDAKILIDKKEVGTVPTSILLAKGAHVVEFVKPGFISSKKSYLVDINDTENYTLNVEMSPYTLVTITSDPSHAEIHFDDDEINLYSPTVNTKIAQGIHKFKISKQGYLSKFGEVNIYGDTLNLNYVLPEAFPVKIRTDKKENFIVTVYDSEGNVLTEPGMTTTEPIYLPYGKYKLKLEYPNVVYSQSGYKITDILAYKGSVNLNGQEHKTVLTFSDSYFALLGGTWYPSGAQLTAAGSITDQYRTLASADLIKFKVFKGYSTSMFRGNVYKKATLNSNNPEHLFSASCLLLNGELRFGGAVHENIDICLLGSYNYLPDLKSLDIVNFDYVHGLDWFAGIEVSSRIPVFNGSIRIGWQEVNSTINEFKERNEHYTSILKGGGIVFSLGFTLGGMDSKGVNYIRVF